MLALGSPACTIPWAAPTCKGLCTGATAKLGVPCIEMCEPCPLDCRSMTPKKTLFLYGADLKSQRWVRSVLIGGETEGLWSSRSEAASSLGENIRTHPELINYR